MIAGAYLLCNQFEERCPACCTRASCALPSVPVLPVTTPTSLTPRCPFGKTEVSPAPAISPSARVASAYSCPEEMTRGKPDCATAAVSADNTIVTSDATGDDPIILVSSSCSESQAPAFHPQLAHSKPSRYSTGTARPVGSSPLMPSKRSCRPAWQPRKQPNPRPHQSPIPRYRFSRKVGMT